ncbi:MAG: serine/threonine protein kinase [Pirellulales bacterium]|nr:serine/threonine protein kinase [Pirellulales bacterium]
MNSSDATPTLGMDDSSRVWDLLAGRIETLVEQWESGAEPPLLADLLEARDPPNFRRLALIELIKVDLEYRWQRRQMPRLIEEYVAEFPELIDPDLPCDLIYEEFHVRRRAGESVRGSDYYERFPEQAEELRRLIAFESPETSTSVFGTSGKRPTVAVGERLDEFDLLAQLGSGAFATVFLARQNSLQRLVAVKVSADRGTEPQTLAQLDHPHIVRVYDQRVLADRKLRLLYMQYVAGGTLHTVVDLVRQTPLQHRTGRLVLQAVDKSLDTRGESPPSDSATRGRLARSTWPEAVCWLGSRLASALAYAHRMGVLHRDVKPANVLLAADASPKLVDFNISFSSKLEGATPAAYFGGSLAYMSPEQLEACNPSHDRQPGELDRRADVYSVGVMLWELLTGERPFPDESVEVGWAKTLQAMAARRRAGVPAERIAALPRDLPAGLKQVLLECLEPDVDRRMPSAEELGRQLALCLQPRAQRLMRPARMALGAILRNAPITSWAVAGLLPNAIASVFNVLYNLRGILNRFPDELKDYFFTVMLPAVNLVAYPIGFFAGLLLAWPVCRAVHRLRRGKPVDLTRLPALRRRCLVLGDCVALVVAGLWLVSGLGIPLTLQFGPGTVDQPVEVTTGEFVHFEVSQLLFGFIAATLCFFLMTFVGVRGFYPLLLQPDTQVPEDGPSLGRLANRLWIYLAMNVTVPFVAVLLLAFFKTPLTEAFIVLGALGLVGFAVVFLLTRVIQADLAAMQVAVRSSREDIDEGSIGLDSFWTRSR